MDTIKKKLQNVFIIIRIYMYMYMYYNYIISTKVQTLFDHNDVTIAYSTSTQTHIPRVSSATSERQYSHSLFRDKHVK